MGEWKDDMMHGQGTYTYSTGDKYVGEWKNDEEHGQGTMTYADGDKYVGELQDGKRHGRGTHTNSSGDKYVGEWENDVRHGQGTMTYSSGAIYEGEWKDGIRSGYGTYTLKRGDKYEGEWENNMWNGQGTYTFADGRKYVGEWKDGEIIKKNENKVQETPKPIDNLAFAIIKASRDCALLVNPMLDVPDEKEKKETEYRVFFKFVYFFMHMTMRSAFSQLTEQQITKLQGNLDDLLADAFFADRPEDLKERIIGEFLAESNDAELEYSTCKELVSEKSPLTGNSLFSKLARNVAELSGNPMKLGVLTLVIESSVDAYNDLQLDSLVYEAGKIL